MKAKVAVYNNHDKAIEAIKTLHKKGFPMEIVSLVGNAEIQDDHLHVKSLNGIKNAPVLIGTGAGVITGILTGIGVFAVPGFGFLYGAGALIGAIAGFDIGMVGGGIGTILANIGIKEEEIVEYEVYLKEGRFIIVINGTVEQIEKAEHILHTEGTHLELN